MKPRNIDHFTVPPVSQPDRLPKPDLGPLTGKTVLVVDDEADIRSLVAMMLKSRNIASITTDNVDEAVAILSSKADEIALVLLDLSVPNSSKLPAVQRLRTEYPNIPLIVMSGLADTGTDFGKSGDSLVGYLRKPFRPAALYDAIAQRGRMADQGPGIQHRGSGRHSRFRKR